MYHYLFVSITQNVLDEGITHNNYQCTKFKHKLITSHINSFNCDMDSNLLMGHYLSKIMEKWSITV